MSVTGNFLISAYVGIVPIVVAYRNTHLPITQQDCSGSRFRVCRNDLVENMAVREAFASFLKKTGIREDVFFGEQVVEQPVNRINQELRVRLVSSDEDEEPVKTKRLTYFMHLACSLQPTDTVRELSAADERVLENIWPSAHQ
jgi:hypothetical protein